MDTIFDIIGTVISQLQKPMLAFLLGGMMLAALGRKLAVPEPVYKFVVMLLLLKVGHGSGISIREADLVALAVPAVCAILTGIVIVLLGSNTLARWKVSRKWMATPRRVCLVQSRPRRWPLRWRCWTRKRSCMRGSLVRSTPSWMWPPWSLLSCWQSSLPRGPREQLRSQSREAVLPR